MIHIKKLLTFLCILPACFAQTLFAGNWQSIESIQQAAQTFAEQYISSHDYEDFTVAVQDIDPRLHFTACQEPLTTFLLENTGTYNLNMVGVRCHKPQAWKIFVPIKTTIRVPALVSKNMVRIGQTINFDDVQQRPTDIKFLPKGVYTNFAEIAHLVAKTQIRRGTPLTPDLFTTQTLVRRGHLVKILVQSNSLQVQVNGVALTDGKIGQQIKVKNLDSKRVIAGTVTENGHILVAL